MRATTIALCSALLAAPVAARAQESTSSTPSTGAVDVGAQITSVSGDEARYQHYRDLRTGVLVDGFHLSKAKNDWTFKATAAHVGYRDQKYTGEVDKAGRLVMTFSWDQIPLFYGSVDSDQFGLLTASPYTVASPGVSRLPDSLQTAVQANTVAAQQRHRVRGAGRRDPAAPQDR